MTGEQTIKGPEIEEEKKLPREVIANRLLKIYNSEPGIIEDEDQLREWMSQTGVFESFRDAINTFGRPKILQSETYTGWPLLFSQEVLFDELEVGEDGREARVFQARLLKSSDTFGPAIHVYARDGGIPTYGIFLPFTEAGTLDSSRSTSGSHYLSEGPYSFDEPRKPVVDKDGRELSFNQRETHTHKEVASVIVYATQMAASQLVFYLDKIDPSSTVNKDGKLAFNSE